MSMNWKEKKKEILEEVEKPQMDHLSLMAEVSRIKYQNDLVMKSLAEYTNHFKEWEGNMNKTTNQRDIYFRDKIDDLKESNDELNKSMRAVISSYEDRLNQTLKESFKIVETENRKYINQLESQIKEISEKHKESINLSIWAGKLKIISSILTPILLIYIAFFR